MSANPTEFLEDIQRSLAKPRTGEFERKEYQEITQKQLEEQGINITGDPLEQALGFSVKIALRGLSADERIKVEKNVAFGVAQTGEINAAIYASADGAYAILLNRGLMMFLNKYLKLIATQGKPENLTYIDSDAQALLDSGGIEAVLDFVKENYFKYGEPLGGKVKPIPELAANASILLSLGETFAVCHEIGHYLNGDLDSALEKGVTSDGAGGATKVVLPVEHTMDSYLTFFLKDSKNSGKH